LNNFSHRKSCRLDRRAQLRRSRTYSYESTSQAGKWFQWKIKSPESRLSFRNGFFLQSMQFRILLINFIMSAMKEKF